jgi:hypothetical protein
LFNSVFHNYLILLVKKIDVIVSIKAVKR